MSTNAILPILGRGIAKSRHPLLFCSVIALVAAAGCNNATVDAIPTGGTSGGGNGKGGSGNGGGNGGSSGCGNLCIATGPVTIDSSKCGDSKLDQDKGEQCDDGNKNADDGCNKLCQIEANWKCPNPGQACEDQRKCGNKVLTSNEACDDGNEKDGDGCSADCMKVDPGYQCRVPGQRCTPLCGDKKVIGSEMCDDGNDQSGDGCSSTCQVEPGAACPKDGGACTKAKCGNGVIETGELCDCGTDATKLPKDCKSVNGLFYGDGKGCSKTCTKEPNCQDNSGKTQACSSACGDGNLDPDKEKCDDGNQVNGDGCSSDCVVEGGFTCSDTVSQDSTPCSSGTGDCLALPIVYRDFQPENVSSGGHPDFFFLGTKFNGSKSSTTVCVPNSGGPSKGNDSTKRCVGIVAPTLLKGKPQPGTTTTCECQFSDWNIGNSGRIPGNYTEAGNDSPLSTGGGGYLGGTAGSAVSTTSTAGANTGTITGYTSSTPGGPIFKGTVPAYKNAASFNQWFNDDATVNKTYTSVLEMKSIGSNIYQYASDSHLATGGFYPLDTLNPSQATLCNLWPYWNHGNGNAIWTTCTGDQYFFPPRVVQSDCPNQNPLTNGCWVTAVPGQKHDSYFTDEARYYFVYDGATGIQLSFFGDDDLFIFINGQLVLDLGGVHQQLPGKVTVTGSPGDAQVTEGGCLDTAKNIVGVTAGSVECSPTNNAKAPPTATSPDDFSVKPVKLGLVTGKVYEIAIFGADRHPPESNYQLTLNGYTTKHSNCAPRCGDGVVSGGEECDDGDDNSKTPHNDDSAYGGCTTKCKFGPFCGDGTTTEGKEQCDKGKDNGSNLSKDGCTFGCTVPHFCGDTVLDTDKGEQCDLGSNNGVKLDASGKPTDDPAAEPICDKDCKIVRINL